MREEPFYIWQTGELMSDAERQAWFEAATKEAHARGATFFRFSIHETIPHLILIEGWKKQPADQGEPRFAVTYKE